MSKVSVNIKKSKEVGEILAKLNIRPTFYERPFLKLETDANTKFIIYLFAAGICHQTYTLYHPKKDIYGWDFMEYAFIKMLANNSPLLNTKYLSQADKAEIKKELIFAFAYDEDAQKCNLDRLEERARMLKEMGTWLQTEFDGNTTLYMQQSGNKLFNKGKGYYETLAKLEAFEDPLRKKATFFLKLARDAKVVKIEDTHKLIPIMDYHMQRVLLRTGAIEVHDKNLYYKLIRRETVESDKAVREAAIEAMRIITSEAKQDILVMNDYFWTLGRSCCNNTMLCRDHSCEKDPCSFEQAVELKEHKHCIFETICKGAKQDSYANLWQPIIETHYY